MGWHESLYAKLKACGYQSVIDYLRAEPFAKFETLAQQLGPGALGQHLISAAAAEAGGLVGVELDRYVKENFVRWCQLWRPDGWGRGMLVEFRQAAVLVDSLRTAGADNKRLAEELWRQVKASATEGWLPAGPDDDVLARALERAREEG